MDINSLFQVPPNVPAEDLGKYEGIRDAARRLVRTIVENCPDMPRTARSIVSVQLAVDDAYFLLGVTGGK